MAGVQGPQRVPRQRRRPRSTPPPRGTTRRRRATRTWGTWTTTLRTLTRLNSLRKSRQYPRTTSRAPSRKRRAAPQRCAPAPPRGPAPRPPAPAPCRAAMPTHRVLPRGVQVSLVLDLDETLVHASLEFMEAAHHTFNVHFHSQVVANACNPAGARPNDAPGRAE